MNVEKIFNDAKAGNTRMHENREFEKFYTDGFEIARLLTYFSETSDANALVDVITFAFYGRFERGYQAASV